MRVALIIPSLKKYGPIVFTDYLVRSLINKVDYVEVFYFSSHTSEDVLVDFKCPTTKIDFLKKYDFSDFDIIHSTMFLPDLYVFVHSLKKIFKCVTSMHNYIDIDLKMLYPFYKYFLMKNIWYFSLKRFDNFIVSSNSMHDFYSNKLSPSANIEIINYGIPTVKIVDEVCLEDEFLTSLKTKYKVLGSCGLLIKRKGFIQLIELLKRDLELAVVIIGSGPEFNNLRLIAEEAGVLERFHLLGFKSNYLNYYKYFDIFVMCSYSEGFGIAMLEALSLKLPLICSELDIYENVFSNENVCFFEPNNIDSLSKAVKRALSNFIHYSNCSYSLYLNNFNLDVMGDNHIDFYNSIL